MDDQPRRGPHPDPVITLDVSPGTGTQGAPGTGFDDDDDDDLDIGVRPGVTQAVATAIPADDGGACMTLADAARNVGVKAKKTILRWAQAESLVEKYGRTPSGGSTIERVVPVAWIVGKMKERGLTTAPQYEAAIVLENASFDPGNRSNLPVQPGVGLPPEALEALAEIQRAYQRSMVEVRGLLAESETRERRLESMLRQGQEEEGQILTNLRRGNRIGFAALSLGVLALAVGIGFSLRLGVSLHRKQSESGQALEQSLRQGQDSVARELADLRAENERLAAREEDRIRRLAGLQESLATLQADIKERDQTVAGLLRTRETEVRDLTEELGGIQAEKKRLTDQLKDLMAEQAGGR